MADDRIAIRRLVAADLPAYKALRDEALAAHPQAFTSDASETIAKLPESYLPRLGLGRPEGGHFTLGAWAGTTLVGAVSCERETRVKVRHITHLIGMMVSTAAQGRGIGSALLQACLLELRNAADLEMVTLTVTQGNAAAVRLYERAGFVLYGCLPRAIRTDDVYHAKDHMVLTL